MTWAAGPLRSRFALRLALLGVLLTCVFVVDTVTDREIAVAVFYVGVILVGIGMLPKRGVAALACACVVLTVVSLLLSSHGSRESGLANAVISISAIAITTYLGLRLVTAVAAVHESRAELARVARQSRLGELAASIAHELNQPLAAIAASGNAALNWMDREPPNLQRAHASVERIVSDANRASDVVARVRGLVTGAAPQREPLSINSVIGEAVELARHEMDRRDITLRLDLADNLPTIWADPIQLQQVVANLLVNAIEAMHQTPSPERELSIASCTSSGAIVIAVTDSGIGLSSEAETRLFDAFWTSKQDGLGIGLTISRAIIEAHSGRIWATPRSTGTTVQFSLPFGRTDGA